MWIILLATGTIAMGGEKNGTQYDTDKTAFRRAQRNRFAEAGC